LNKLLLLFSLPPILKGFIAMVISGAAFPLCGVMVLRLNLVPMRYMLMHGVILGGAIALALKLPLMPVTIAVNLILIFILLSIAGGNSKGSRNFSGSSAATMVLSMALASLIMHVKDVPAKDTLDLLWGSPFALSYSDLVILSAVAVTLCLYIILNYRNIQNIFFSSEMAQSMGINVQFHYSTMVILVAVTVAIAMKLLGAFLIDALLILPVICAGTILQKSGRTGLKKLFIVSLIIGCTLSTLGYVCAVMLDLPPTGTIALLAGLCFAISKIIKKRSK